MSVHSWNIDGVELRYTQYEDVNKIKWMDEYKVAGVSIKTLLEESGIENRIYNNTDGYNFGYQFAEVISLLLLVAKKE